ncbi:MULTISPECIES: major tail protein [Bacillus]|uniref:major tail protein n=1 Tax=Bacillus TaxID=1386 RepID=UPI000A303085|nr:MULTISPECIES: major tail protein [Bacillus cereus group]MBR3337524.1 phage tail protein [Bacillus sp. (in: firmicutes)]ASK16555.1 phage tail protein [Bacillus cereus]MBL3784014.1 phage tail protein [Bacillus cereus]MBL3799033.1 phage tail protein [Bacillus cereus]MBL3815546.1 phage tail protein [Bacillus cereus]
MTKEKALLYPVGIESLYIAMMVGGKDAKSAIPTYEEIDVLDVISELGIAGNNTTITKWASNKLFVNASKNTKYTLSLSHVALPQEIKDAILGYVAAKGIVFNKGTLKEYPMFAVGFVAPLSDGSRVGRWYPRVQVVPSEETYTTTTEEFEIKDQAMTMEATPLLFNDVTEVDFSEARASATGVKVEDFMKQVICDESQLTTIGTGTGE